MVDDNKQMLEIEKLVINFKKLKPEDRKAIIDKLPTEQKREMLENLDFSISEDETKKSLKREKQKSITNFLDKSVDPSSDKCYYSVYNSKNKTANELNGMQVLSLFSKENEEEKQLFLHKNSSFFIINGFRVKFIEYDPEGD